LAVVRFAPSDQGAAVRDGSVLITLRVMKWPAPWPLPLPRDWLERVHRAETKAELEQLRISIDRGQPYGSADWSQEGKAARPGNDSSARTTEEGSGG